MNYIILDLEWNQSAKGKLYTNQRIPFEIIQIGAVKTDEYGNEIDRFDRLVRPVVYPKLHSAVKELLPYSEKQLKKGRRFREVFAEFMKFCGEDPVFCTWGSQDLWQLQQNARYYRIQNPFPCLMRYYDVQKLFSIAYEDGKLRRTVEYAAETCGIEKTLPFHSAVNDAVYVAEVFRKLTGMPEVMERISVDYFRPAMSKEEELSLRFAGYTKHVYRVFPSKEEMMLDKQIVQVKCPVCGRNLRKKIRWFSGNAKKYLCIAVCPEHGLFSGKLQIKRFGEDAGIFPVKIIKPAAEEDIAQIVEIKKQIIEKRRLKRKKQSS